VGILSSILFWFRFLLFLESHILTFSLTLWCLWELSYFY
jgi:hypothetical protein